MMSSARIAHLFTFFKSFDYVTLMQTSFNPLFYPQNCLDDLCQAVLKRQIDGDELLVSVIFIRPLNKSINFQ